MRQNVVLMQTTCVHLHLLMLISILISLSDRHIKYCLYIDMFISAYMHEFRYYVKKFFSLHT